MNAPFYEYGLLGDRTSLVIAIAIGVVFGFFLERGGLGDARKLAAQFYLTDLTVLKVMFSAIVTAALGLLVGSGYSTWLASTSFRPTWLRTS